MNEFDELEEPNFLEDDEDDYGVDDDTAEVSTAVREPIHEPLFSWLLRQAVGQLSPEDNVLHDYVTHVAPHLSEHLALKTAKGGRAFLQQRRDEGATEQQLDRYRHDQSLRAHLVNGLLPVIAIAHTLHTWGAPRFSQWDETTYRLFCAGFTLHDWGKLPDMEAELAEVGLVLREVKPLSDFGTIEAVFRRWGAKLGLDVFLEPVGGLELWLHELMYIAANTQKLWGTLLNQNAYTWLRLNGRARDLATDLSTLADYLAYIAPTPIEVVNHPSITDRLYSLSGGMARLVYHHIAENRGVLTNFIHNAATQALSEGFTCQPLLFAPSGVVYLTNEQPHFPETAAIAEATIRHIRRACAQRIQTHFVGFSRAGKGLKAAPYYDLHLSLPDQIRLTARAVFKQIPESKKGVFAARLAKVNDKGWLADSVAYDDLPPTDIRVDQLAEFCAFVTNLAQTAAPDFSASRHLLQTLHMGELQEPFEQLQSAPNTGGTPYHWYLAAAHYTATHGRGQAPEQWRELLADVAEKLATAVEAHLAEQPTNANGRDGWDDLRAYIQQTLSFGPAAETTGEAWPAADELLRYQHAKQAGRKATTVCSLCSSPYTVSQQREAGILFAPQVYTNKQPLHGSKALRHICSLCETEMMLRQILMNRGGSAGKRFEERKFRYLYFYPTYFFTPETLWQLSYLYDRLKNIKFTNLRQELVDEAGNFLLTPAKVQRLADVMSDFEPPAEDRLFRLHFPTEDVLTFFFLGFPPGRDAKDAEAWINPAIIALLMPLVLDTKVVATESSFPLLHEAKELPETLFFDAPHAYVADAIGNQPLALDEVYPAIQKLVITYLVHMDGESALSKGEYRWHAIPPVARNLAAHPFWAAHYLKKWQRREGLDGIPAPKANLYYQFLQLLSKLNPTQGGLTMTEAEQLVTLYRQFYRHSKRNSNSILRPLAVAAKALLEADVRLFPTRESLIQVVEGELHGFAERVASGRADGRLPKGSDYASREQATRDFAHKFVSLYFDVLGADPSALRGKQLNLLKNACEVIYLNQDRAYWADQNAPNTDETLEQEGE